MAWHGKMMNVVFFSRLFLFSKYTKKLSRPWPKSKSIRVSSSACKWERKERKRARSRRKELLDFPKSCMAKCSRCSMCVVDSTWTWSPFLFAQKIGLFSLAESIRITHVFCGNPRVTPTDVFRVFCPYILSFENYKLAGFVSCNLRRQRRFKGKKRSGLLTRN